MHIDFDMVVSALANYDESGFPQIQTDSPGVNGTEGTQPAEALMPLGLIAMPLDPDKGSSDTSIGNGVTVLRIMMGDHRFAMPFVDPRSVSLLPKVRKGGAMLYGGAGDYRSFVMIDGLDPNGRLISGSITMGASYKKNGVKASHGFSLDVRTEGEENISMIHGDGQRITMTAGGSKPITLSSANGASFVTIDDDGTEVAGTFKCGSGAIFGQPAAALPVAIAPIVGLMFDAVVTTILAVAAGASTVPTVVAGVPAQAAAPLPALMAALRLKLQAFHLSTT